MKKGKVFGKTQIIVGVMLLALCCAVWLNMKYAPTSTKYLGEASFVSNKNTSSPVVETKAKATEKDSSDYFETAKKDRENAKKDAEDTINETLKSEKLTENDKKSCLAKTEEIANRVESETNIENLLKAKGFEKALAVISDTNISIVVKSDGLTSEQTLQIQDIVTSQTSITLNNIKIIPIK